MIKDFFIKLVPPKYRFVATDIKNNIWRGFKESHYSQFGEDIIIGSIFSAQNKGFYVDVGAHHPKRYSNTYLLHKKGWSGINIDSNPDTIKLFNKHRTGDINLECAISDEKSEQDYYNFSDPAMNTFSKVEAEKLFKKKWLHLIDVKKVSMVTLAEVLRVHVPVGVKIDLLSVDAEGFDLKVLRSNDWSSFVPRVIIVEDHSFSADNPNKSEIYNFLSKNYRLHSAMNFSLIFIRYDTMS